jgi:hypothetical protein
MAGDFMSSSRETKPASGSRSLAGILHRMTRIDGKHSSSSPMEQSGEEEETETAHTEAPIPLRPGDMIALRPSESQEHLFAYEPGAPLPARGGRPTPWAAVPLSGSTFRKTGDTVPAPPVPEPVPEPTPAPAPDPVNAGIRDIDVKRTVPAGDVMSIDVPDFPLPAFELPPIEVRTPEPVPAPAQEARKDYIVSNVETILKEAMQIDGAIGVSLVDYTSGMTLGQAGGATLNMDVASAGNTEVVRAKLRTMDALGLREGIEDILITLDTQYHIIRLITDRSGIGLFLYLALNKQKANLAMARRKLSNLEAQIEI